MNRGVALTQLASCLRGEIPKRPNWNSILELANDALVTSELYGTLRAHDEGVPLPVDVRGFLAEVHRRNRHRNQRLYGTLVDAVGALNKERITPVLLKGCCTWVTPDGRIDPTNSHRTISDIDMLVAPHEAEIALRAFQAAKFRVLDKPLQPGFHAIAVFGRSTDVGSIDLHRRPPGEKYLSLSDILASNQQSVSVGSHRACIPSPEVQIIIAAVHDQLHERRLWRGGFHFRHLLDLASLTKAGISVDWSRMESLCPSSLGRRALDAHLTAARALAGAAVPVSLARAPSIYARQRMQFVWPVLSLPFWIKNLAVNVRAMALGQPRPA